VLMLHHYKFYISHIMTVYPRLKANLNILLNVCNFYRRSLSTLQSKVLQRNSLVGTITAVWDEKSLFLVKVYIFVVVCTQQPVPVAARSKAYVCGRSPAEIVGSHPA
jgi:hypothetical protein